MRRYLALLTVVFALGSVGLGCEEDVITAPPGGRKARTKGSADPKKKGKADAGAGQADGGLPIIEYSENDFVESEENRDPFRSYVQRFMRKAKGPKKIQRKVKAESFALDEMTLTGIITRGTHRAMLTDPSGFGWVVYTGDLIGKPELVSTGGPHGEDVLINWRVDRVREKDVVFVREDPAHPEVPPSTRIILLHPAGNPRKSGS